ncbi:MAG: hypothetical protein JWQ42_4872 [Edaphobacter sp.]|nr:hypothetical protein [Edaphobacter sp.]
MKIASEHNEQVIDFPGDPRWELVQRLIESPHLVGSARLRDFLLHVAACAIRQTPEEATEQQIGIQVFQRSPGFNSSEDSIVRSQARLLRLKLSAYFNAEGASEPLIIEIPKGHYLPVFLPAHTSPHDPPASTPVNAAAAPHETPAAPVEELSLSNILPYTPVKRRGFTNRHWQIAAGIFLVLILIALTGFRTWHRYPTPSKPLNQLWSPFLTGDPPLVIYSNAVFIGDAKRGMRYAAGDGSENQSPDRVDNYTGIGELSAVHELTRLFDQRHAEFILKRSPLVTWDEARSRNLIFIGSIAENGSLKELPSTQDFTLVATADAAGIVNHHPRPGEPETWLRPEHPLTRDYAIVALLPGIQPDLHMFVFSGLTTLGTQAAVEYASNPEAAAELLRYATSDGRVHNFEALLEVSISGGVPLQPRLLSMRVH